MKILKITSFYPVYLNAFYTKNQHLRDAGYAAQINTLNYDAFGWGDFWSQAFKNSDHEMYEVTSNNELAQKAWALENDLAVSSSDWYTETLVAQAKQLKPDILFFEDRNIPQETIQAIKDALPNNVISIAWCGTPFTSIKEFQNFDVVIGCIPDVNKKIEKSGKTVFHLNHAFDPRILKRINNGDKKKYLVSFVGQIIKQGGMHSNRSDYIRRLSQMEETEFFSPAGDDSVVKQLKEMLHPLAWNLAEFLRDKQKYTESMQHLHFYKKLLELDPPQPVIPKGIKKNLHPPVFGLEMFQVLRDSKVCFNIHIDASKNSASNMRLFEVTGVGSCLLTDEKENLSDLFAKDEVVSYHSVEDCVDKIQWLLENDETREKIAKKGQERTLRDHTFEKRAQQFASILQKVTK